MQPARLSIALLLLAGWTWPGAAQSIEMDLGAGRPLVRQGENRDELPDTFYPTKSMIRFLADGMSEQLREQLGLDPEQLDLTRSSLEKRISHYLVENRNDVQPVLNDFLGLWSQRQAPTVESVQEFARKALPVFNSFQTTLKESTDDWREFLTEEQGVMLDGNMAAFDVGARFMTERLQSWEAGEFDPATQWRKAPGFEEKQRAEDKRIHEEQEYASGIARGEDPPVPEHLRAEMGLPPSTPQLNQPDAAVSGNADTSGGDVTISQPGQVGEGAPIPAQPPGQPAQGRALATPAVQDEWGVYVEQFCGRYALTAEQRARAAQFLQQAREQRDTWQSKKATQFARLEQLMATAKTDQGRETAKQQLDKLRQPFQTQFSKLKERLEKLPTREQRAAAVAPPPQANATPPKGG